jgi:uncharacterized protein
MGDFVKVPKIALGATGVTVSRLALGGFHQLEISSEIVAQVVDAFLEVGGSYIETARGYGNGASEDKLGRALVGRRDRVVLASKSGAREGDAIRRDLETTLELLRTDHIEFYFFHGVATLDELDTITGKGGAMEALLRAKEEGMITGMGFSSHRPPELYLEAMRRIPLSVILIWDNYLEEQWIPEIQQQVYPLAREKGVGITAMKPLADGFLYRSPEAALRYAYGSGSEVLVCGMNRVEHVYEAAAALAKDPADVEERQAILRDAPELGSYVCRQCGGCSPDLMALFRLEGFVDRQMIDYLPHDPADYALRLRLAHWFDLTETARRKYAEADWDDADLMGEAEGVKCPYGIDVARKATFTLAKLRGDKLNVL